MVRIKLRWVACQIRVVGICMRRIISMFPICWWINGRFFYGPLREMASILNVTSLQNQWGIFLFFALCCQAHMVYMLKDETVKNSWFKTFKQEGGPNNQWVSATRKKGVVFLKNIVRLLLVFKSRKGFICECCDLRHVFRYNIINLRVLLNEFCPFSQIMTFFFFVALQAAQIIQPFNIIFMIGVGQVHGIDSITMLSVAYFLSFA